MPMYIIITLSRMNCTWHCTCGILELLYTLDQLTRDKFGTWQNSVSQSFFTYSLYMYIYIYTFRAESLHCSRLVNLTPVTYIPSREIRIAGLVMKKKGVTFPILNDYSCGISVIGSWNCLLRMRSFSHCHGVAKEVAMGHVQRLNISTASVQKWYFNVTLRIMGSQVQWCFGDPKEPWKIQSQTPL